MCSISACLDSCYITHQKRWKWGHGIRAGSFFTLSRDEYILSLADNGNVSEWLRFSDIENIGVVHRRRDAPIPNDGNETTSCGVATERLRNWRPILSGSV
ncbi:hypothetical protein CBL_11077 [Carabus blaptoides fortunei]